jgi:hypothetical protein
MGEHNGLSVVFSQIFVKDLRSVFCSDIRHDRTAR